MQLAKDNKKFQISIGEALRKCGYDLFYYKKDDSYLEEDFFVRTKDYLVPVEVKATNGTAKSLRTLLKSDSYPDIKYGIKFTSGNIGYSDNIYTFPYFCAFLLKDYLKEVSLERENRGQEIAVDIPPEALIFSETSRFQDKYEGS